MNLDLRTNRAKIFNDLIYEIRSTKKRIIINYGGANSGKSYSQHQNELINLLQGKGDILFLRKYASDIFDSCYALFKIIAEKWQITDLFHWAYSNQKREISYNGKRIIFKGLDDSEKLKSIANIRRVVVEEASQITKEDFLELNRRARGFSDIQIILLLNPIDERHWIKEMFFDGNEFDDDLEIFHTTYSDNKFATAEDIKQLDRLKRIDPNQFRIYALGEWGKYEVNNPYFQAFDERNQVSEEAKFVPEREIRISFDFNVDNTTCVLSHAGGDFIHFFREMSADNLPKLLDALERDYGGYRAIFKITGDSSGRSRHHLQSDDMNSYRMIKNRLRLRDSQFKIKNNPKHKDNRFTCNTILAYHPNVLFHPGMTNTIYDLKYVECDKDENIIKKDRAIPNQRCDFADCVRYTLNTFHFNFIKKYSFKK